MKGNDMFAISAAAVTAPFRGPGVNRSNAQSSHRQGREVFRGSALFDFGQPAGEQAPLGLKFGECQGGPVGFLGLLATS